MKRDSDTTGQRWTQVATKADLMAWLKAYPRELICDVQTTGEPPIVMWHDMTRSSDGLGSWATCVASYKLPGYGPEGSYRHIEERRCDHVLSLGDYPKQCRKCMLIVPDPLCFLGGDRRKPQKATEQR